MLNTARENNIRPSASVPAFTLQLHSRQRAAGPIKCERRCSRKQEHLTPAVSFPTEVTEEVNEAHGNSFAERKWDASF